MDLSSTDSIRLPRHKCIRLLVTLSSIIFDLERDANKNTTILFLSQFQPLRDCYEHLLNMEIILRWSDLLINLRNWFEASRLELLWMDSMEKCEESFVMDRSRKDFVCN